jgi:hypothetical protein
MNMNKAVMLTDDGHPNMPEYLSNLGFSQGLQFQLLGILSDLENAISNIKKAVVLTDDGHPNKAAHLVNLGITLQIHFQHVGEQVNLVDSIASFKAAAQLEAAYPSKALLAARQWAKAAHLNGDLLSALDGYHVALKLLPKVAWLGLDTFFCQSQLIHEKSEDIGCLAATCAIQLGHLVEAIELLDLGRSVLWQQASSLQSDLEMLREHEPELAHELEIIGKQLDAGNFSGPSFIVGEHNVGDNPLHTGDIGKERRQLVGKWEELVERVRQLPQFQYFLRPVPFHQLRQTFKTGQVIIVNASEYGVDGLIFGATGPIEHVPLPNIDLETLTTKSNDIVHMRPTITSTKKQRTYVSYYLKPAMSFVWHNIVIPIFNRIHIPLVNTAELPQHRIWWYLTGPLTFIPLHAAGPGKDVDVSSLAISSYVTTLQSLFEAQKKVRPMGQERFLGISQQDTPGQAFLPQAMEEVHNVVQVLCSSGWPKEEIYCLHGSEATVDRVSIALNACSWVHFSCHGFQDHVQGMKSAFALHDGHLELSEIASKRLSIGQFAFLSGCHAALGVNGLPGEAIHFAAGFQFAGFPSVIAPVWGIHDNDASKVAAYTYQYLFRNGLQGLNPSEAAAALNYAIMHLREDPCVTMDQWASFIHFGI